MLERQGFSSTTTQCPVVGTRVRRVGLNEKSEAVPIGPVLG